MLSFVLCCKTRGIKFPKYLLFSIAKRAQLHWNFAINITGKRQSRKSFANYCAAGNLKCVKELIDRGEFFPTSGFQAACESNQIEVLKLLINEKIIFPDTMWQARYCKNITKEMLKYLYDSCFIQKYAIVDMAFLRKNLEFLDLIDIKAMNHGTFGFFPNSDNEFANKFCDYLQKHSVNIYTNKFLAFFMRHKSFETAKRIAYKVPDISKNNLLEFYNFPVEFLISIKVDKRLKYDYIKFFYEAVCIGNFELLQYAYKNIPRKTIFTGARCYNFHNLDIVKFLLANKFMTTYCFYENFSQLNLQCAEYLHSIKPIENPNKYITHINYYQFDELMDFLLKLGANDYTLIFNISCQYGSTYMAGKMLDIGNMDMENGLLYYANNRKKKKIVNFLYDRGVGIEKFRFRQVCYSKNIKICKKYMKLHGMSPNEAIRHAVKYRINAEFFKQIFNLGATNYDEIITCSVYKRFMREFLIQKGATNYKNVLLDEIEKKRNISFESKKGLVYFTEKIDSVLLI